MKRFVFGIIIMSLFYYPIYSQNDLKVFISVDMEGITGVVHWEDVRRDGKDYDYFRKIMTKETNAAIEGLSLHHQSTTHPISRWAVIAGWDLICMFLYCLMACQSEYHPPPAMTAANIDWYKSCSPWDRKYSPI